MSQKSKRAPVSGSKRNFRDNLDGIRSLKKELLLRLALLGHSRSLDPSLELKAALHETDRELSAAQSELQQCETASLEEDQCLDRVRQLEDQRFHLLSKINGNRISGYSM